MHFSLFWHEDIGINWIGQSRTQSLPLMAPGLNSSDISYGNVDDLENIISMDLKYSSVSG